MSSDPSLTSQVSLSCSQVMGRICSKVRLFSEASPSDSLKCMYFMMEARRLNPWAWKCEGPLSCVWTFTQLTRHHVLSLGCVWISSGISEALNILLFLIYLFLPLSSFFFVQVDKLFSDAHCSSWFIIKATEEQPWSRYIQGNGGLSQGNRTCDSCRQMFSMATHLWQDRRNHSHPYYLSAIIIRRV